ncbi:SPFH/Band 7/PHB domain protein [Candidatus Dependentiae bacterium]|nr:SPFH/Band 7/PHB domain protein [Candidatus Dependentiae bacterium]
MIMLSSFIVVFLFVVIFLMSAIARATYMVRQAEVVLIERLGKYHAILRSGLHFVIPFVDRPRRTLWTFVKEDPRGKHLYRFSEYVERIDLREAVYDFPKQNVITKDNVTMEINALLYYQITDPKRSVYEVANLPQAIEKLTQTTLRNIIGSMDLDESLSSRDQINEKLRLILDEATDKWGVKVNRVELQEVNPPEDIRVAMEKQMRAERDRRATILEAEGKKRAAVLDAEGEKLAKIARAEGEAEARLTVAKAESEAIKVIKEAVPQADPLPYMVALNYIKALPEITKDKQGKMIILPYETSGLVGSLAMIKEIFSQPAS